MPRRRLPKQKSQLEYLICVKARPQDLLAHQRIAITIARRQCYPTILPERHIHATNESSLERAL